MLVLLLELLVIIIFDGFVDDVFLVDFAVALLAVMTLLVVVFFI